MKRIILILLVSVMLVTQTSCAPSNIDYNYSGELDGGRWFLAEMWENTAKPLVGSFEHSRADKVYVNSTLANGETRYAYRHGTLVRIEYDGEMYLASGMDAPVITNVYSVTPAPLLCAEDGLECYASYFTVPFFLDSQSRESICIDRAAGESRDHYVCITKAESRGEIENICSVLKREDKYVREKLEDYVQFSVYDDAFFEDNVLYFIFFTSGSNGDEFKINKAAINGGIFEVGFLETNSGVFTEGEQWLVLISLDRETADGIIEYNLNIT